MIAQRFSVLETTNRHNRSFGLEGVRAAREQKERQLLLCLSIVILGYVSTIAGCEHMLKLSFADPDDIEQLADPNDIITPPDANETQP